MSPAIRTCFLASLVALAELLWAPSPVKGAQVRGDKELLRQAALLHRANWQRLRTWSGTAIATDVRNEGGVEIQRTKSVVEFVCDFTQPRPRRRWNWTREELITTADGVSKTVVEPEITNGIIKDGVLYRVGPLLPKSQRFELNVRDESDEERSPNSTDFDPTFYCGHRGGDLAKRFEFFLEHANSPDLIPVTVSREDDLVFAVTKFGAENDCISRYVADLSKQGNLVHYYAAEPQAGLTEEWTLSYIRVGGVYLPQSVDFVSVSPRRRFERKLQWVTHVVNSELPPDAFELVKLGLRRGDKVRNNLTGTRYRIKSDAFPPARKAAVD
jgi:hypothetical protein